MGKPFDRHARLLAQPICTVLSDQKANIRAAGVQTLSAVAEACEGVDCLIAGVATALESTNPLQKGTVIGWAVDWFKEHPIQPGLDLKPWVPLVVVSLDDRSADVRKASQALLPTLIQCSSFDYVMQQTSSLKPASRNSAVPLIQAARPTSSEPPAAPALAQKAVPVPKVIAAPEAPPVKSSLPTSPAEASIPEPKPALKGLGVRRKLPQGLNSRPESRADSVDSVSTIAKKPIPTSTISSKPQAPPPVVNNALPFSNMNLETRKLRLAKDASRWVNEGGPTRKDLAEALQSQMEPHSSKDLVARLFSHDHNAVNDHIAGLSTMAEFYLGAVDGDEHLEKLCLANLDFPFKYASIKFHEPQPNLISKCLDVTEAVLSFLRSVNYQLTDNEVLCFIPTVIFKVRGCHYQSVNMMVTPMSLCSWVMRESQCGRVPNRL